MYLEKWTISGKAYYSLKSRFIQIKGREYEVFGGKSTGKGPHDVEHWIRDMESKKEYEYSMDKIIKALLAEQTEPLRSINVKS